MPILQVKDLQTEFSTREGTIHAVDGISFDLEAGETLGLVGESGCGKSVTALSIMRLIPSPPGSIVGGEVIFDGRDLLALPEAEVRKIRGSEIAMVFQDPMTSLNPVMTVGLQIAEGLEAHEKLDRGAAWRRAIELLDLVGIPGAASRIKDYPHQFSGGMRQRVMIAIALSCHPKLILADEITTALDVTIQAQILAIIRDRTVEVGTALVMITHDLGVVAGMTQRVHVMYAGQIVEKAETDELFANPKMPYTWGLLRSIPRLDEDRSARLVPIEGQPPNMTSLPSGCRFEPRCPYSREICKVSQPDLLQVDTGGPVHEARCWGIQDISGGGWLRGFDWRSASASPVPPRVTVAEAL